jgi:hypothetical protein
MCQQLGNTDINLVFALGDGTVIATSNRSEMERVATTSADFKTSDAVADAVRVMASSGDGSYLSLTNESRVNKKDIISANVFGEAIFGKVGFLLVIIPASFYFSFIDRALWISIVTAIIGTLVLVAVTVKILSAEARTANGRGSGKGGGREVGGGGASGHGKQKLVKKERRPSMKDLRQGSKKLTNDRDRIKLLHSLVNGTTTSNTSAVVQTALIFVMTGILMFNFMYWNSSFQAAITKVVEATSTQIAITAKFSLDRTFAEANEVTKLIRLAQDSGYLKLGVESGVVQTAWAHPNGAPGCPCITPLAFANMTQDKCELMLPGARAGLADNSSCISNKYLVGRCGRWDEAGYVEESLQLHSG